MIITDRVHNFREAARHVWNAHFRHRAEADQNWDLRDAYSEVYVSLFNAIVRFGLPGEPPTIPNLWEPEGKALLPYRLVAECQQVPVMINRDNPASGYWDHPIKYLDPTSVDLRLLSFFDWDALGFKELRYYRARIISSMNSDLTGREVLVDIAYCGLDYMESQQ